MRIELAELEKGRGEFSHSYAPGELPLEDDRVEIVEPPTVSGKVRQVGSRAEVSGRVSGRVRVECDRCLKPIELPVDSVFEVDYVTPADYETQRAAELTEDDLDVSTFDGETIDVDELIIEELLLAVPDHVLCSEDCKGICPTCSVDRNVTACTCSSSEIDPRWADLKKLVNRES